MFGQYPYDIRQLKLFNFFSSLSSFLVRPYYIFKPPVLFFQKSAEEANTKMRCSRSFHQCYRLIAVMFSRNPLMTLLCVSS